MAAPYPPGPYEMKFLSAPPDITFQSDMGPVSLRDFYEPCAPRSRLLVMRFGAAWCGTCRWHLQHTQEMRAWDIGPRLRFLDVALSDRDNYPPTPESAAEYRALISSPGQVAIDPERRLVGVSGSAEFLPLYVVLDTRTMKIRIALSDPDPDYIEYRLRDLLATLDKWPSPPPTTERLFDGTFPRSHWEMVQDMTLPGAPPPDTTNAKADDPSAASLGKSSTWGRSSRPSSGPSASSRRASTGGDLGALTAEEKIGFHVFFTNGCAQCHWGPRLTDEAFHAVRFPTGRQDKAPDPGRAAGIPQLLAGEFLASSPWSDDPSAAMKIGSLMPASTTLGAFKTPSLRGLVGSGPYGHGGSLETLLDVADLYSEAGLKASDPRAAGVIEPWIPRFAENHRDDVLQFLKVLNESPL